MLIEAVEVVLAGNKCFKLGNCIRIWNILRNLSTIFSIYNECYIFWHSIWKVGIGWVIVPFPNNKFVYKPSDFIPVLISYHTKLCLLSVSYTICYKYLYTWLDLNWTSLRILGNMVSS